jgi:hypothetical protein
MKKWISIFVILNWGCENFSDEFGTPDQILLLADREVVCGGQTSTLRLFSTASKKEISISEIAFDALAKGSGNISASGVYTPPVNPNISKVTISGTIKSGTKVSTILNLKSDPSYSAGSLTITPFAFFNEDEGRPSHFWSDGSVVFGTGKHISSNKFEVIKYSYQGALQWKKDFGSGEAKFIQVFEEKIYAAGLSEVIEGEVFFVIVIFDLDGNLVGKGWRFTGWLANPILSFFDKQGNLIKIIEEGLAGSKVSFKGPNGTIGIAYSGNSSNLTRANYYSLLNSQGQEIVSNKMIGIPEPYSGSLDHPAQKKLAHAEFLKAFAGSSGEIHVISAAFWGHFDFLTLNSSSGNNWIWWKENKERTAREVLYPMQILEEGSQLIVLAHSDGRLYRFVLSMDYSFDDCLREPYWNKLDVY